MKLLTREMRYQDFLRVYKTPEAVERIFNNPKNYCNKQEECDECGSLEDTVIQLGNEPDYDSQTAQICINCLEKALKLIKGN